MRFLVTLLAGALLQSALAGSYDRSLSLTVGTTHFERLGARARVYVGSPGVVQVESLRSGEVVLDPKAAGETMVFLQTRSFIRAWRVSVGGVAHPTRSDAGLAEQKCPDLEAGRSSFRVTMRTAECYEAVLALTRHYPADEVKLVFTPEAIFAQLAAQKARLEKDHPAIARRLELSYLGATLRVRGTVEKPEDLDAAMRALWEMAAGRMVFDASQVEVKPPPPRPPPEEKPPEIKIIRGFDEEAPPQ